MKKIFLQVGMVALFIGGTYSISLAGPPLEQVDFQQNQIQFQAQPHIPQMPDLQFDPNAGGVLGNPPIDYKGNVISRTDSLIDAIKKVSKRIEESKYMPKKNKEAILANIEEILKEVEKIKSDAENKNNFDQVLQEQFILKIGSLFGELRLEIPKNIIEKQLSQTQQKISKLQVISDKIAIYISIAKKQGFKVDVMEDNLVGANKRLTSAKKHIDDANKLIEKIKPGVNFDKAKGYFKEAHKEFRLAQKDIKTAKLLLGKSVAELKKMTNR